MTDQKWAEEDEGDKVGVGEGRAAGLALVLHDLDAQSFVEWNLTKKIQLKGFVTQANSTECVTDLD